MQTTDANFAEQTTSTVQRHVIVAKRTLNSFAPLLTLYLVYTLIRWMLVERGAMIGDDHANEVIRLEGLLGLDWEAEAQSIVLSHELLARAMNYYYVLGFFPVLVVAAILAAHRVPQVFAWWRQVFAVSLALAIVSFALFPLTPPRLMAESKGYVDTLLLYGPHYYGDANGSSLFNAYGSIPSMVNVHAAMPSMHVGWSVVASILLIAAFPDRLLIRTAAILHPFIMGFAVVATANHFVLDVFAGVAVVGVSFLAVRWYESRDFALPRLRTPA